MSNGQFIQYKALKQLFETRYRGYLVDKVIAQDLVAISYWGGPVSFRSLMFVFLTLDFRGITSLPAAKVFCTMGRYNRRKDYYEIAHYVWNKLKSPAIYDLNDCRYRFVVHFKALARAFFLVWRQRLPGLAFKQKIALLVRLVHYFNCIDELEKYDLAGRYDRYLGFSSVHAYETIFTLYFQQRHVPTYSLQHGLYFIFREDIPIDALSYENFVSDFHFCWGAYTRDELIAYGIEQERLPVGGYPRDVQYKLPSGPLGCKSCLVFLARQKYSHSNAALINIIKNYQQQHAEEGVQFYFKMHPTLDAGLYREMVSGAGYLIEDNNTLTELLNSGRFDFSLAVNTAAYYESYIFGVPSLRFHDHTFENSMGVRDDVFEDLSGLEMRIRSLRGITDLQAYGNEVLEKLNYIIGISTSGYEQALLDKVEDTTKTIYA